ncbi:MAG TPA: EAL domain-containing protein [Nitrospiria bacterium]
MISSDLAKKLTLASFVTVVLIGGIGFFVISGIEKEKSIEQLKNQASALGNSVQGAVGRTILFDERVRTHLQNIILDFSRIDGIREIGVLDSELNILAHNEPSMAGEQSSDHAALFAEAGKTRDVVEKKAPDGMVRVLPVFREREVRTFAMTEPGPGELSGFVKIVYGNELLKSQDDVLRLSRSVRAGVEKILQDSMEGKKALQSLMEDIGRMEGVEHIGIFSRDFTIIAHTDRGMVGRTVPEENPIVAHIFGDGRVIEDMVWEEDRYKRYFPISNPGRSGVSIVAVAEMVFSTRGMLAAVRDFQWKILWLSTGLSILLMGVLGFVIRRVISDREKAEEKMDYLVHHDDLTGLATRELLVDRLTQALIRSPWTDRAVAVISLNFVQFKRVNETLGHRVGDLLLQAAAKRLKTCIRGGDTIARLGGDHFVMVLADMGRSGDEGRVGQNIIDAFTRPFNIGGHELFIKVSLGISIFPQDGEDSETLLANAETAMGRSKDQGYQTFQYYSPEMSEMISKKLLLETALQKALKNGELFLNYQPIVEIKTGKIVGLEALLRWNHPEQGPISPMEFIPLAEESGLIHPIGEWVLRTSCEQARLWRETVNPELRVGVNLSARQFQQTNLLDLVRGVLKKTRLEPDGLVLELTESILMKEADEAVRVLSEFKDMKIDISIDDFGTGYSSLSYLKKFPINTLKIDRSFIKDVINNPDDGTIVKTIITMAHSMKLQVVAEGVETREQLEFLRGEGCDKAQGYLFSRPLTTVLTTDLLKNSHKIAI